MQLRPAVIQVSSCATCRDGSRPDDQRWRDAGVIRMQAQRACFREAVQSYKRERTPMRVSIGGHEFALHKPHLGVESVWSTVIGVQVCPPSTEFQVSLCDNTAEVGDDRRVMACIGVIGVCVIDWPGEEVVEDCTKASIVYVWNWLRFDWARPGGFLIRIQRLC